MPCHADIPSCAVLACPLLPILAHCHAQIVKELVPLLEKVVAADYPLWRAAGAAMDAARQDGQEALSTGGASGPAFTQTMGQGGVSERMRDQLAVRRRVPWMRCSIRLLTAHGRSWSTMSEQADSRQHTPPTATAQHADACLRLPDGVRPDELAGAGAEGHPAIQL